MKPAIRGRLSDDRTRPGWRPAPSSKRGAMGDKPVIQKSKTKGEATTADGAILLADGSRDDVALTLRAFRKSGVRNPVTVAHDGFETLDHLFSNGARPGLVMLDLKLSRLSGLDVIRRMRANELTRHLPAIVLISSDDHREVLESYGLKADGYVRKPVDFLQLRYETGALDFEWMVEDVS